MINLLKKRYKVGDIISIHTTSGVITGIIDSFEDSFVIITTDQGEEFVANEIIQRVSVPKKFEELKSYSEDSEPITSSAKAITTEHEFIDKDKIVITSTKTEPSIQAKLKTDEIPSPPKKIYKAGDTIPLSVLEKRSNKKTKFKKQKVKEKGVTFSSLSELKELILPEMEEANKKIVSANGIIKSFFADRNFGFIEDKSGRDIWFGFKGIIDDTLLESLRGTVYNANIPILFSLSRNFKGDVAIHIQKPKTVYSVLNLAQHYFEKENKPDTALGLIDQVLISYPENLSALNLKEEIGKRRFGYSNSKLSYKGFDLNYQKAKQLHNTDKNYEEALRYYYLALENNEKKESSIKDIAMLHVAMGEIEKAKDFIRQYELELPDTITTYNFLENFFGSVKDYEKVLEYIDLLLDERYVRRDNRKLSMYLSKKGYTLIQLNELDEARASLDEAIGIQPENTFASRLLQALDEPDREKQSQIIAEAEFDSFGGGFSKYIKDTLEKYDEYFGVPPKVIDSANFSKETLSAIRRLIDTAGKARPRERANYLLTEAKLMTSLEPEKESSLRSVLARYCNAMALNHISENSSMDVIRYYYLEAFSLEENYGQTAPQIGIYLFTFKTSYTELLSISTKTPSIDDALSYVLKDDYRENIWESILSMFLWNRSISAQIISKLFEDKVFRKQSILYLSTLSFDDIKISNSDDYINIWNQAREKRQRDYTKWFASLKAISNNENLETLTNLLLDSLEEARKNWLTQLDASRLSTIATNIYEVLTSYLRQSGYRDKERSYNFAKAQINQLITEILEKPTKFSYEGFIPLLERIEVLLDKSFKTVEAASTPKVEISIMGEANVLGNDNIVPFQIKVETSKNSSPIHNTTIEVQPNEDIMPIDSMNEHFDSIDGGESHIFEIRVKVSDKVAVEKATSINIICHYNNRNENKPIRIEKQLSLRLYSEDEFEVIPNPYEKLANGGPVTDTNMFYGRNEFIDRITEAIISTESKQVVIYGQKRSGKSSVLYHLKKSLENTNQTFCVTFSIGEIFENISSATFFHKILFTIEEELENMEFEGVEVPEFKCPPFTELDEYPNPADIFRKHIRIFKRNCQLAPNWQNKKLVIMIDEFTYLYTAIKEEKVSDAIMKQWKAITQNEESTFSAVLVGQDIFPQFKSEFPNEFGVTQDERLTYLAKRDALRLIEEPVWNKKVNKSRYLEDAADKIIEYTSCNPYYIQIFCARLIKEMNDRKFIEVTRSDIKPIADSFLFGGQALTDDKFDNLLNAGEKHDIQNIPQELSKAVLKKIAEATKFVPFCSREDINIGNKEMEDIILRDLKNREVIEQQGNNYKIQVKLFQEWLLKN